MHMLLYHSKHYKPDNSENLVVLPGFCELLRSLVRPNMMLLPSDRVMSCRRPSRKNHLVSPLTVPVRDEIVENITKEPHIRRCHMAAYEIALAQNEPCARWFLPHTSPGPKAKMRTNERVEFGSQLHYMYRKK